MSFFILVEIVKGFNLVFYMTVVLFVSFYYVLFICVNAWIEVIFFSTFLRFFSSPHHLECFYRDIMFLVSSTFIVPPPFQWHKRKQSNQGLYLLSVLYLAYRVRKISTILLVISFAGSAQSFAKNVLEVRFGVGGKLSTSRNEIQTLVGYIVVPPQGWAFWSKSFRPSRSSYRRSRRLSLWGLRCKGQTMYGGKLISLSPRNFAPPV